MARRKSRLRADAPSTQVTLRVSGPIAARLRAAAASHKVSMAEAVRDAARRWVASGGPALDTSPGDHQTIALFPAPEVLLLDEVARARGTSRESALRTAVLTWLQEDHDTALLSVAEAAEVLGVTGPAVTAAIRRGSLRAEKRGRAWLISLAAVSDYLEPPEVKRGRPRRAAKCGPGRPRLEPGEETRAVVVRAPSSLWDRVDEEASARGQSRAEVVREALGMWLEADG